MPETEQSHTPDIHTPEPWKHNGKWRIVADLCGPQQMVIDTGCNKATRTERNRANARRIVACVNACEGVSTQRLEGGLLSLDELDQRIVSRMKDAGIPTELPTPMTKEVPQ